MPKRIGFSKTHIDIEFDRLPNATFYLVETNSSTGTSPPPKNVTQIQDQMVYLTRIEGLQPNTMYTLIVTPYIMISGTSVRGHSSPPLNFYTENPPPASKLVSKTLCQLQSSVHRKHTLSLEVIIVVIM